MKELNWINTARNLLDCEKLKALNTILQSFKCSTRWASSARGQGLVA